MTFAFLNTTFDSDTTVMAYIKPGAVRFHMTAPLLADKLEGAQKLAEELSNYVNFKYPEHDFIAVRENIGARTVNSLVWRF